jgi:hypothetical protein
MTIRDSFVEHFGEECATRLEEASIGHLNDLATAQREASQILDLPNIPYVHEYDSWGDDPFMYHFMNAIARECMGRFAQWHGIEGELSEFQAWSREHADLHTFAGDPPDYIALMVGAYYSWINWERAGITPPEGWEGHDDRQAVWGMLSPDEVVAELKATTEDAMRLLNEHDDGESRTF